MKNLALALLFALALTACDRDRHGAEEITREALKDPESARFGDFYFNPQTKKGCLTVNAKNSMGGYTGDQQSYVEKTDKGWENVGIADIPVDSCRRVHADRKD